MSETLTTLVTGVATIITNTLRASKDLHDIIDEFLNAPEHIRALKAEVHQLHTILGTLQDVLPQVGETRFNSVYTEIVPAFESLQFILNNCCSVMVELSRDLMRYTNGYGEISNDRWLAPQLNEDGVKDFCGYIGAYTTSVKLSMSVVNLIVIAERTGREMEQMTIQVDQLCNKGLLSKSHDKLHRAAASQDIDHEFALRQFLMSMESVFDSPLSPNEENSSVNGETSSIEKDGDDGDGPEVYRSPPHKSSEPSKRHRELKKSVKFRKPQSSYSTVGESHPAGILAVVPEDQNLNSQYFAFVEDAEGNDFLQDRSEAEITQPGKERRVLRNFDDLIEGLSTQPKPRDGNPISTFERVETRPPASDGTGKACLGDTSKPLPHPLEDSGDGLSSPPQNANRKKARKRAELKAVNYGVDDWGDDHSLDDNCKASQIVEKNSDATESLAPYTEQLSKFLGHDLLNHDLGTQATDEGMNGQYYTVPPDGSPVTVSVPPRTSSDQDRDSRRKSQTSLLIEYFEGGKGSQAGARTPKVRVKVIPSSKSKSLPPRDQIQITERRRRTPTYTKRTLLSDGKKPDLPMSDDLPKGGRDNRSVRPQGSSSNETNNSWRYDDYEEVSITKRRASLVRLQGSSSNETNDSIRGYNPIEVEIMPRRHGSPIITPEVSLTPSLGDGQVNSRFKKPHSSSNPVLPSLLQSETRNNNNDGKVPEVSRFSRSSINNPKLLETVEEAIQRLILPELTLLKQKQAKKKQKADNSMDNNPNDNTTKNEEAPQQGKVVDKDLEDEELQEEEAARQQRSQERRHRRAARNAAKNHTLGMAADTLRKRRSKTQNLNNFDNIPLTPILEDRKSIEFIIEPPDMTDKMDVKDKEAAVNEWIKELELSNEVIEKESEPKVVPKKVSTYGDWANPPWMPE